MNQKGQVELLLVFIVLAVVALLSQRFKGEKLLSLPTKKEVSISKPKVSPSPIPPPAEKKPLTPPPAPEKKIEPAEKEKDTIPPQRRNPLPSSDLPAETRKTTIFLETGEKAVCRYGRVSGLSYDSMPDNFQNTNATSHSSQINYLSEGEKYVFYVKCQDESSNKNTDDFEISFSVKKPEDKTPPDRRHLSPSGALATGTSQTELTVGTDEKASCSYSTQSGADFWQNSGSFRANETGTFHTSYVSGLISGKIYDYFVRCCDTSGNCNKGEALIRFGVGLMP